MGEARWWRSSVLWLIVNLGLTWLDVFSIFYTVGLFLAFGARRICHSFSSWVHVGGLRVQPVRSCCSQVKRGR